LGDEPYWPEHHGFDVNVGGCSWGHPKYGYFSPYRNPRLSEGPRGEYLTDRLTDEAIKLVKASGDEPFFLHMSHYAVHMPLSVPERYRKKYRQKARDMGLDKVKTFEKGEHFPITRKRRMRVMRRLVQSDPEYAGMIENLDENVGRLLRAVDEAGKASNTVVVFTSDNGGVATYSRPPTTNAPLAEGKGWMYEGGTRVNLIVKWPGHVRPGTACSTPVTSTDFYPTILEAAGLPPMPEQHRDGVSIVPLLEGRGGFPVRPLFWHFPHYSNLGSTPAASVRDGRFKLIEFFEDHRVQLFDLEGDIKEDHDLAAAEPEKAKQLKDTLHEWLDSVDAKYPTPNPRWKPQWDRKREWKRYFEAVLD
ncbi:MAG: sulfatase, partial [Candidatus Lokiarchaeota archaeon]|nr:sulfatase [Candidatus Lokiarchaeota archaeon]